jgi:outer membrane protein OmpA-like peptidoglycan-associated protein
MKNIASKPLRAWGVVLGAVTCQLGAVACQPAAPSNQLVTARQAYDQVRQSGAAELDPTGVQEAHASLQAAEAVHVEAPGSRRERSHAYISARQSELALWRAREAAAIDARQQIARAEGVVMSAVEIQRARAELEQREAQLRAALMALAASQAERDAMMSGEQGTVRVTGVFFQTGRDELTPASRHQLDMVAKQLTSSPELQTVIEGFTDTRGDEKQNLELSARRANKVREYLSARGVDAGRVQVVGLGENYPVASNATPTGRAANRRAEISTGAHPASPSPRGLPPDAEDKTQQPEQPPERQPVKGEDTDFPDDPQTREPDAEPR